jgi:hypothetical protein
MFQELKSIAMQMLLDFKPKLIMSDFEPDLLTTIRFKIEDTLPFSK